MTSEEIIAETLGRRTEDLEKIIASLEFELFGRAQERRI